MAAAFPEPTSATDNPSVTDIPLPSYAVPESGQAKEVTFTSMDLHRLLGVRKLADYSTLGKLYDGVKVDASIDAHPGQVDDDVEGTFVRQPNSTQAEP